MASLLDLKFLYFKVSALAQTSSFSLRTSFKTSLGDAPDSPATSFISLIFEDSSSRNSLSLAAARELLAIVRLAEAESYKGLLFQSRGRIFCSGGNLKDYAQSADPRLGIEVNREITDLLNQLSVSSLATLALIEGDCFGGGLELLSAFDELMAIPGVMFGFWQRRIGLSFGWGGGHRLARRLGEQTLVHMALEARGVFAPEALDSRLIDAVVGKGVAQPAAIQRLEQLTRFSKFPLAKLKGWRREQSSEAESAIFEELWWNTDHQKALEPFRS